MGAAKRRSCVDIEKSDVEKDDWGHETAVWVPFAPRIWAHIKNLNGKSFIAAGKEVAANSVSIRINFRLGVTTSMRVKHGGTIYKIQAVLPDEERRRYVDLVCSLGAWDG